MGKILQLAAVPGTLAIIGISGTGIASLLSSQVNAQTEATTMATADDSEANGAEVAAVATEADEVSTATSEATSTDDATAMEASNTSSDPATIGREDKNCDHGE